MATQDKETKIIDLFQGSAESPQSGMTVSNGDWGISFIQNMQINRKAWEARPGFGVICQYDTKLNAGKYRETFQIGLEKHLGSHLIKQTSFNHEQIVSIWRARVVPENMSLAQNAIVENLIQQRKVYVVRIYDTTTDETWEEILHYHTSQEEGLLFRRHANYETSVGSYSIWDRQAWIDAGQNEGDLTEQFQNDKREFFYFTEVSGVDKSVRLIFGNERAGAWVYCPTDFRAFEYSFRERWHQAQADATQDWRDPYAESPLIIPIRVTNGSFADNGQGLTYMDQATFGRPQAACTLDTRVVYAVDNLLYFSDPEVPNAILEANIEAFPSKIVAVAPTIGNLIVWTEDRHCYYYNPATGAEMALISGGRITEMSSHIGIVSCNAWVSVEGGIIWIDPTGIW